MNDIKILIVEDNRSIRMALKQFLSNAGYAVCGEAETSAEAVRMASSVKPDLILMDIILKGPEDGIEAIKAINREQRTPFLFMTGERDVSLIPKAKKTDPSGYLTKPFDNAQLVATIEMAMHNEGLKKQFLQRTHELDRKVRELNCLFSISKLVGKKEQSVTDFLSAAVKLIPPAMLHPEKIAARINYRDKEFKTASYRPDARSKLTYDIRIHGQKMGGLEISFLAQSQEQQVPFLLEEIEMIQSFASHISVYLEWLIMERTLKESERKFRLLFEQSNDGIIIHRIDGLIVDANHKIETLTGYGKSALLNKPLLILIEEAEKESFQKRFQELKETGNSFLEAGIKTKDNREVVAEISLKVIDEQKGLIQGIFRDITERKKAERDLIESNVKLQQTQASLVKEEKLASIGRLAAGVAHEINNPLGFVSSNHGTLERYLSAMRDYIALLKEDMMILAKKINHEQSPPLKSSEEKEKIDYVLEDSVDLLKESRDGLSRITKIVENLRSFSRIDSTTVFEKYDMNAALESTLVIARNEVKYVSDVDLQLQALPLIECFGNEINQVLLNIIINAAQAIKSQNSRERGKIAIKTYPEAAYVYCEITDSGPGIPAEAIERIFDPFFTTKKVGEGTGLGLSISYDIIKNKHHGELQVKSQAGKGATFIIKLPIKQAPQNHQGE